MSILILSPHYDDAAYSCGGTIYQLSQQGIDVTMLTVMAGQPSFPLPDTPIVKMLHERWELNDEVVELRHQEDAAAAKILGAKTRYLDIPDCIYRLHEGQSLYPTLDSLWGAVHPQDPAHAVLAQQNLGDVSLIYAPLGVGRHIDHQLVRDWALKLQASGYELRFYQDYPYLRKREDIDAALSHFGEMQAYETILSEAAMQAKIASMAAYASQITTFWENETEIDAEVRESFSHPQGYAEISWGKRS
jgi:LmbE family N-acetylglucosaminyl deacetylase